MCHVLQSRVSVPAAVVLHFLTVNMTLVWKNTSALLTVWDCATSEVNRQNALRKLSHQSGPFQSRSGSFSELGMSLHLHSTDAVLSK